MKTDFHSEHCAYLHEALFEVYDEYYSDNEVLLPNSYIAYNYQEDNARAAFELKRWEGVSVEVDDYPEVDTKLVLMPAPFRLELHRKNGNFREIVWELAG